MWSVLCVWYEHLVGSLALSGHLHTCHHTYYLNIDLCVCVCVCFVLLCLCVYLCVGVCVRMLPSLALADHLQACHHAHHLSSDPDRNSLSSLYLSIFKSLQDILAEIWGRRVGHPRFSAWNMRSGKRGASCINPCWAVAAMVMVIQHQPWHLKDEADNTGSNTLW